MSITATMSVREIARAINTDPEFASSVRDELNAADLSFLDREPIDLGPRADEKRQAYRTLLEKNRDQLNESAIAYLDDLTTNYDEEIADFDRRFPRWEDELNGLGYYETMPCTVEIDPSGFYSVWRDNIAPTTPPKVGTWQSRKPRASKGDVVVRAAGYTSEELEAKILAHVELAVDSDAPLGVRALLEEIGGNKRLTQDALKVMITDGRIIAKPGSKPNSKELWPATSGIEVEGVAADKVTIEVDFS